MIIYFVIIVMGAFSNGIIFEHESIVFHQMILIKRCFMMVLGRLRDFFDGDIAILISVN